MEALILSGFILSAVFTYRHITELASLHAERQDSE